MEFALLHQVQLILADMVAVELVGRPAKVLGETANRADIGDCGSLRVIPTLEFLERPFSKLGHRDLLVTHTIWQRRRPLALITRSVRRASGLVHTALLETWSRAVPFERHLPVKPTLASTGGQSTGITSVDRHPTGK